MTVIDTAPATPAATTAAEAFVLDLGVALHRYGAAAHRVEEAMARVAERLGLRGHFFASPTAIQAGFEATLGPRTHFVRVEPGADDLGRLADLDEVLTDLVAGRIDVDAAERRMRAVLSAADAQPTWWTVASFAAVSGAAARFLGGGLAECAAAIAIGLVTGLLDRARQRLPAAAPVFEVVAAFLASLLAVALARGCFAFATETAVLAGLIVLIPGLTLTVAVTEVATRQLTAGSTRLTSAVVLFCMIAFGAALGAHTGELLLGPVPSTAPVPAAPWTNGLALLVAPLAFAVILRARRRDWGWIAASCWIGFGAARVGALASGPELGATFGAFAVTAASNLYARWLDRPASVPLVPGILMLVPGSVGFRSLSSLMAQDVVGGVQTAVTMVVVAAALVTGLLLANALVPSRRSL